MKNFDISNIIVSKIFDVCSYTLPERTEAEAKAEHCVLLFRRSGSSSYTVDSKEYTLDGSTVLFIPAGTDYSLFVRRAGECMLIELDVTDSDSCEVCEFSVGESKEIAATLKNILHYWSLKGPAYHSKCLSELYLLITHLSAVYSGSHSLASKYRTIHKSVKFIEANYRREDLYTPDLAKMSGVGETYYRNIFISVFSVPPAKYIQNCRVEKAKELLVGSALSTEEIATSVGFANASYFCKVFKASTGLTPSEFAAKKRLLG